MYFDHIHSFTPTSSNSLPFSLSSTSPSTSYSLILVSTALISMGMTPQWNRQPTSIHSSKKKKKGPISPSSYHLSIVPKLDVGPCEPLPDPC